jgi:RNA-directed DNA polymerase
MTDTSLMPVRNLNLVVPLAHEATDKRITDTAARVQDWSRAVTPVIGVGLRRGDVDSTTNRSTPRATPGTRTSTTATRTTTTRAMRLAPAPSADSDLFERLVVAYIDCRRTKRTSTSAQAFEARLERNLIDLRDELVAGVYTPGRSSCFVVTHPKPREVWAANFRDRVVHHLLYNHIAPRFLARFTADSCACIPGRGTLYAARRLEHQVRSATENWQHRAHYLKCDLANFFVSIDKAVLADQLARGVTEPWWLDLTMTVLMHDPRADVEVKGSTQTLQLVPPHKSLFNAPAGTGLPIGNLSSQFFANVLLDDLDQRMKHQVRAPHYVRYVDDFILVHRDPQFLSSALRDVEAWLPERLHVRLNPSKTILQPVDRGIDFVGHVLKPWHRSTRKKTITRAIERIEFTPRDELRAVANSYFGLLRQADSHTDRARLARAILKRGKCVNATFTQTY